MSPRCMLSVLFSHVWRGKALSLIAFLITLLVPLAALADDNPYRSSEACFTTVKTEVVEGKTYSLVTFDKDFLHDHPRECDLRTAYNRFPIRDSAGKLLSVHEWERSIFAANQGSHPTVLRGCVPDRQAPAYATDEEKASCPKGKYHYYPVPSNGWKVYIRMPQEQRVTWAETQAAAAKVACAGATTPEAKKACQDAGYQPSTSSTQTPAPVTADTVKFSKELEAKIAELQKKLAESEKALGETKEQLATTERSNSRRALYGFLVSIAFIIEVIRNWRLKKKLEATEKNLKSAQNDLQKAQKSQTTASPNVATLSSQLKAADDKLKQMAQGFDEAKLQWQATLAEANRQKDVEITGLRDELGRKNREVQYNERLAAMLKGQAGGFHFRANELTDECDAVSATLQKANTEITGLRDELGRKNREVQYHERRSAELEGQVAGFRYRLEELKEQLAAANDNAAQAIPPSTVTLPPTTEKNPPPTATTPPSTEISQPAITLRGFPAVTPPADQGQQQSVRQCQIQNESNVFRTGMPEIIFLLGGDPQVLVDTEPEAIMIRAIELASDKNAKVVELESQLTNVRGLRGTAEKQVAAHERAIGQLSLQLEREGQDKAKAISRETVLQQVIDGFEDKATDPEKKVLEALFKAARLDQEVATLQFSVHRAETKQQVAERECDQAVGAFHQLNLLYTFSQAALQAAVSGSDCIGTPQQANSRPSESEALSRFLSQRLSAPRVPSIPPGDDDPEIEARESWNGPEPVTVPKRATLSPQVENSTVISKDQLDQGQAGQPPATPYVGSPPSPHHKTIPIPAQPEPKPDKSGQGNG